MDDDPPKLDRIIAFLCRRARMSEAEAADFASCVKRKLIENDYAIMRMYRGDSNLRTFLTVVISRLLMDYRNSRPSADA